MRIAAWNVNSIRSRQERVLAWLEEHRPEVLCLQELKVTDDLFEAEAFAELGYHAAIHGQKTYNGVGILSLDEPEEVLRTLGDDEDDPQARVIAARIRGVWIASLYCPNGSTVGSDKWHYKLRWYERLRGWLDRRFDPAEPLALAGDYNIAPDDRDVENPARWADSVLCHPEIRKTFDGLLAWGLEDVFRRHHEEGGTYSWWDYRRLAFPKNDGLRIDHILATPPLAQVSTGASVDREARKGSKPSDHAPVLATFDLERLG